MARALPLHRLPALLALCLAVAVCFSGVENAAAATTAAAGSRKMVGVHELKIGDFSIKVTNWGATLMSVILPDSKGNLGDVVLGYDTVAEYVNGSAYFGGLIGRVANRIAGARFVLDGKAAYRLYRNDGNNSLHGGHRGFSKVIWTVKEHGGGGDSPYITLYYHSFDGEQGFPGALDVYVTYQLSSPYVLSVRMNATAQSKATPVNLAHHAYWNLGGHGSGPILGETVQLFASRYTPVDAALIPTGALAPVAGTPYDFRAPATVGARLADLLRRGGVGVAGYDTNYAVDDDGAVVAAAGGACLGRRDGAGHGAVGGPARGAVLHQQRARWRQGQGRQRVRAVRRAVPRDAGVPRRREPPELPVADRQARPGVQA